MNLADTKTTMMSLVGAGLDGVNTTLQALYDTGSPNTDLINALTMLGSQYTFDQMRVFRAQADRLVAEMDLVRRDEFEALKAELQALRDEVAALKAEKAAAQA